MLAYFADEEADPREITDSEFTNLCSPSSLPLLHKAGYWGTEVGPEHPYALSTISQTILMRMLLE